MSQAKDCISCSTTIVGPSKLTKRQGSPALRRLKSNWCIITDLPAPISPAMIVILFLGIPRGSSLSNGAMPVRKSLDIVNLLLEAACVVEDKILLYPTVWFLQAILYCPDYRTLAATVLMNDLSRAPAS